MTTTERLENSGLPRVAFPASLREQAVFSSTAQHCKGTVPTTAFRPKPPCKRLCVKRTSGREKRRLLPIRNKRRQTFWVKKKKKKNLQSKIRESYKTLCLSCDCATHSKIQKAFLQLHAKHHGKKSTRTSSSAGSRGRFLLWFKTSTTCG